MQLRIAATPAELDALAAEWQRLHEACAATPFQSFEWQRTWWRRFGADNPRLELKIVALEEAGRTVAILPCVLEAQRVLGVLRLRCLRLLGEGITDYLDLLALPEHAAAACEAFAAHLAGARDWDLISFADIPDRSPLHSTFLNALRAAGLEASKSVTAQCPRAQLLDSWEKTVADFDTEHRRKVNFLDRRLKKNFKVELRRITDAAQIPAAVKMFVEMHQAHWMRLGHGGAFSHAGYAGFIEDIAGQFQSRGWLRMAFLQVDGEDAAAVIAYQTAGEIYMHLSASADLERAVKYSPATAIYPYLIEPAIEEGVRVCDFLRGPARYKHLFGGVDAPNWNVLVFPAGSLRARMLYRAQQCEVRSAKWLRAALRPLRNRLRGRINPAEA